MRTSLSIILCKLITSVCHFFNRDGSVFPGSCIKKIHSTVLTKIKYPKKVVVVTGSSGKGSTVSLAAHILENSGQKVIWNKSGSNVKNAIITLVLNNSHVFSHQLDADILLLEMDESYITGLFAPNTISHLCITNITRDQPARNIHPVVIYDKIMRSIDEGMHLIINTDDPLLNRIKYAYDNKITTYGIDKTPYDTEFVSYAIDFAYCPSCHSKLDYSSYHYGHLGIYKCPVCSFSRGNVDYEARNVNLKKGTFTILGEKLKLDKHIFFAVYYTLLAYTICEILGVKKEDIISSINDKSYTSKRMKTFKLDNRDFEMLESKNENSLSYLQSLNYIKNEPGKKTVVMGFENVSRRYNFNDLSWLWDVNFELLADEDVDKIFLIGRFNYDVATRLDYAGIPKNKIILIEDISTLLDRIILESSGNIYTMVCFDMTQIIRNMLKERENEKK